MAPERRRECPRARTRLPGTALRTCFEMVDLARREHTAGRVDREKNRLPRVYSPGAKYRRSISKHVLSRLDGFWLGDCRVGQANRAHGGASVACRTREILRCVVYRWFGLRSPTKDFRDLVPPYMNSPG